LFERSQPASQLARFGVDHAKGSRRSGDRDKFERSQLARFGVDHAKGSRRSGDRVNTSRRMLDLK
jgi:hypothetical protein